MISTTNEAEILKQYSPLVHKIAIRFENRLFPDQVSHEDLVQEGKIGLLKAIRTYDPNYKTKFITWAYYKVLGAITSCKRKNDRKLPIYVEDNSRGIELPVIDEEELKKVINTFASSQLSREVIFYRYGLFDYPELTSKEISEKFQIPKTKVDSILYRFRKKVKENCPELINYLK